MITLRPAKTIPLLLTAATRLPWKEINIGPCKHALSSGFVNYAYSIAAHFLPMMYRKVLEALVLTSLRPMNEKDKTTVSMLN